MNLFLNATLFFHRKNFTANQFLTTDDIAFSATTLDGHAFAKKYVGKDYLIYT